MKIFSKNSIIRGQKKQEQEKLVKRSEALSAKKKAVKPWKIGSIHPKKLSSQ